VPGKSRRAAATAYGRRPKSTSDDDDDGLVAVTGHRHGHRSRSLAGFFGRVEIEVPRARLDGQDGKTTEWNSKVLRAYQRRTVAADALMASTYLAGTNTRVGVRRMVVDFRINAMSRRRR
jgi:putative transposase